MSGGARSTSSHPDDESASTAVRHEVGRTGECAAFTLTITKGADVGVAFEVDGGAACPTLIGSSETCAIRLRDPEVSRRHASVDVVGNALRLRDLESSNGTFINGTRLVEVLLRGGEMIELGSTAIRVEVEAEARSAPISTQSSFGALLGASVRMRRLYPICQRLAESDVPLVIEGETGTGKEVLAEAIHAHSRRASGPFVVFDCTAVPATLIDGALFGHERGAFTGASTARMGVFQEADGGTLLIDEIGDLDKSLQSKLLRAIQKSEVRRLGGDRWQKVDVRVIAATRRDLDREVQEGRFRDDLFFRLAVARIVLPPLRERREDVEPLARHFWASYGGLDEAFPQQTMQRFASHSWPGNVRELANTVARLIALGELADCHGALMLDAKEGVVDDARAGGDDFIDLSVARNMPLAETRDMILKEFERRYVARLLEAHGGDFQRAAAASGIGERYLRMIRARVARS